MRGLTLLELVVVIVVLAALIATAIPTYAAVVRHEQTDATHQSLVNLATDVLAISQSTTATPDAIPDEANWRQGLAECPSCTAASGTGALAAASSWQLHFSSTDPPASSATTDLEAYATGAHWGAEILSPSGTEVAVLGTAGSLGAPVVTTGCISVAGAAAGEKTCAQAQAATPKAPTSVTVTAGTKTFTLTWTEPATTPPVDKYHITCTDGNVTVQATTTSTTWTDTTATDGTTYHCTVRAKNPIYVSPPSVTVTATPYGTPATPTGLADTPGVAQATLSWDAVPSSKATPVTGYRLWRSSAAGGPYTKVATTSSTTAIATGLTPGTAYYFEVTAYNADATSSRSPPVTAIPEGAPQTPANVAAVGGPGTATVTWRTDVPAPGLPLTGYTLWESPTFGGPYSLVVTTPTTSYVDTDVAAGTTYYFEVSAYNTYGASPNSSPVTATPAKPGPPVFDLASSGLGTVNVSAPSGTALTVNGGAHLTVDGAVAVASPSKTGLVVDGGATMTATKIETVDATASHFCHTCHLWTGTNATPWPPTQVTSVTSPMGALPVPATAGLPAYSTSELRGPGVYTKKVTVGNGANLHLSSGVYIFEAGLHVDGGATLTNDSGGVLFDVAGGSVVFSNGAILNLAAMTSGTWAGVLLYQNPADTDTMTLIGGSTTTSYNGVIYTPNAPVRFSNGTAVATGGVVAKSVEVTGGADVTIGPGFTFTIGKYGSYTLSISSDVAATLSSTPLPAGLTFATNANGTATLAGTPTASPGNYTITVTATNSGGTTTQEFVISVI